MDAQTTTIINLSKALGIGRGSQDWIRLKADLIKASLLIPYIHRTKYPKNHRVCIWWQNKTCFNRKTGETGSEILECGGR